MKLTSMRLTREQRTNERMVVIYCRDHHRSASGVTPSDVMCADCREFLTYSEKRLAKCPYGPRKPVCAKCPIHCYRHARREQARKIMRYAGPRMMTRHPWLALMHVADKLRPARHPMEIRRKARARKG